MNNLFENLQMMKESDEDKIINVKLIDVEVLGDDDDYDAWDEHLNELANEYNITIEANGERSVLISGTKENIEEFLWNEYFLNGNLGSLILTPCILGVYKFQSGIDSCPSLVQQLTYTNRPNLPISNVSASSLSSTFNKLLKQIVLFANINASVSILV